MSKRALGKGLDALISSETAAAKVDPSPLLVEIDKIKPAFDQPRSHFDEARLQELAQSIRLRGIIQPLLLEEEGELYTIVAGERRYRAAKIAGLQEVPAIVRSFDREGRKIVSLIENLQREDLNPLEEARSYRSLIEQAGISQGELSIQVGKSRAHVANTMRLLKLSSTIQKAIQDGSITQGHARALLAVESEVERDRLFRRVVTEGLSVRSVEAETKGKATPSRRAPANTKDTESVEVRSIEQQFIEALGTDVRIRGSLKRGSLQIGYYSAADLERLYNLIIRE